MPRNAGWFRFYDRMIDSPQILELSDTEFRLIVSVWCLASATETRGMLPFSARALQRRALPDSSVEDVERMLRHLIDLDLLQQTERGYQVCRWAKHQYDYDSWAPEERRKQKASERGRKHVANASQANDKRVASGRKLDTEAEAEAEAETETETEGEILSEGLIQPVAAVVAPAASAAPAAATHKNGWTEPEAQRVARHLVTKLKLPNGNLSGLATVIQQYPYSPPWLESEAEDYLDWLTRKRKQPELRIFNRWIRRSYTNLQAEKAQAAALAAEHHPPNVALEASNQNGHSHKQPAAEETEAEHQARLAKLDAIHARVVAEYGLQQTATQPRPVPD